MQSVQPLPATAPSGITVAPGADYNTVQLRNAFRRRTHAWVSRIGYFDTDGNQVKLPAPVPVHDFALKATTSISFDNLVIAVGDLVAGLAADIGAIDPYASDNRFWAPVTSAPLALTLEPATAQVSVYQARVLGVGAHDGTAMIGDEEAKLEEIRGETLWEDIALPLVKTVILPLISRHISSTYKADFKSLANSLLLAATVDMAKIEVSGKYFPETVKALRAGDADALLSSFWKEFFGSGVFKKLLETALKATIATTPIDVLPAIRDSSGTLMGVNLLPQADLIKANVDKLSAALTKLSNYILVIKVALTVADYAAMAKDWRSASRVETVDINLTKARVALTPKPLVAVALAGETGKVAVTATVTDLDGLFNVNNVFLNWTCTGKNGDLFRRGGVGTNAFESPLSNPTHDYFPSGSAEISDNADSITVTAFYRNASTNQRIEMGSVTVPVQIRKGFTLTINPGGTDLPTDAGLNQTAHVEQKLPTGATVDWTWTHGGLGSLTALPADSVPNTSSARLETGANEGAIRVTISALIHVPATATTLARTVQTDPFTATYDIKKNLISFTYEAHGGSYACTDPLACGVSHYGAYLVPVMAKAVLYTAVFSGFAFAGCNRSQSWTGVKGDGGGCNFPVTYHPHSSAGPTNTWAVWLGFSDTWNPAGGKCMVTITLRP